MFHVEHSRPLLASLQDELAELDRQGLGRSLRNLSGGGVESELEGRPVLNFCSNDYLGYAAPREGVTRLEPEAARAARVARIDAGAGAARLISGNHPSHTRLEAKLASWLGAESVLLFGSGYQANVGLVSAVAGPEDLVLSDELVHASLIDGCRLSRARVEVYGHRDVAEVEQLLARHRAAHRRCLILTESLFSMDGDRGPIAGLAALADQFDAGLVVDDAHALGVLGPGGAGLCPPQVFARVGTFGKALGRYGAFVAGPSPLIQLLVSRARSFVFTTALPPPLVAETSQIVDLVRGPDGDARRQLLAGHVARVDEALARLELPRSGSHIVPLRVRSGDAGHAMRLCAELLERGIFVQGIRPPTVPPGTARLRLSLSAAHRDDHLDRLIAALTALRPELA